MKKILLVGEHPYSTSGNGHMMLGILRQIDLTKYKPVCFSQSKAYVYPLEQPFNIITADSTDQFGRNELLHLLNSEDFDAVIMVGIDIWHYSDIMGHINKVRSVKEFKWIAIFPYDLHSVRPDWVEWIKHFDYPCVYSQYGYNLLSPHISKLRYFRPPLVNYEEYKFVDSVGRRIAKTKRFFGAVDDKIVFGFVGPNQIRKDPLGMIKALSLVKKRISNVMLYMHTHKDQGVFNIDSFAVDCGLQQGDIVLRDPNANYSDEEMAEVYASMDCFVNPSLQEGLSWTTWNAMLVGTPVLLSQNTAHLDWLADDCGIGIPCEKETHIPVKTAFGPSIVESVCCTPDKIAQRMYDFIDRLKNPEFYPSSIEDMTKRARSKAFEFATQPSDINEILDVATFEHRTVRKQKREDKIIFRQHSAAGDIYMTTRCLKGLKERHKGLPLVYVTQKKYFDILESNPYISEIVDWDEVPYDLYRFDYNPHGERILPGHWGRNSNSILSDFYWKIMKVEPDNFFIQQVIPEIDIFDARTIPTPLAVVHTTGGDPHFRTYKYMGDVCKGLRKQAIYTIQLGGKDDFPAEADLDLRGKLSYRESAYVMKFASVAITVDSFMSHLAGSLGINQVCLFGSGNAAVVRPVQTNGSRLVVMSPDYVLHCKGLGPCSAGVRDCPVPCTGRHDPMEILRYVQELLQQEGS